MEVVDWEQLEWTEIISGSSFKEQPEVNLNNLS